MCGPIVEERETGVGQRLSVESRVVRQNNPVMGKTRVFKDGAGYIVILTEGVSQNLYLGANVPAIQDNIKHWSESPHSRGDIQNFPGNPLSADELMRIGYVELTAQQPVPPPVTEQPVDRLKAAEEATGYELGDAVQFYNSRTGNYEVGRVAGFARVNDVAFLTGDVDREGEGDRRLVITSSGEGYSVVHPESVQPFGSVEDDSADDSVDEDDYDDVDDDDDCDDC